jgi:DNA ligase-1
MKWKTLYHKGRTGALYSWKIWTKGDKIYTEYGQVDGKKQEACKTATPKNVGKKNATTGKQQAELEAAAMFKFKLERKYSETQEKAKDELWLPMLAHDFEKKKKKVVYPVDVQPKLDGLRCIAYWNDGKVELMSRSGKPFFVPHISKALEKLRIFKKKKYLVLDGELYIHGQTFQSITRLVKKNRDESVNLQYWVYDCINPDKEETWTARDISREKVTGGEAVSSGTITHVTHKVANSEEEVYKHQEYYVGCHYEGAIVRSRDTTYNWGYRSPGLLKVKNFKDAEFKVIGWTVGVGKAAETVTWVCEAENEMTFRCYSKGSREERKEMKDNADSYVGRWLKVKFFERTDDNLPRFPIGIGFRLEEDMDA